MRLQTSRVSAGTWSDRASRAEPEARARRARSHQIRALSPRPIPLAWNAGWVTTLARVE